MESKKIFNNKDAFYIAEALDAIKNSLPIPFHFEKEFNDPDLYIIWSKLGSGGSAQIFEMKISLTSAQIQTLNSIPVIVHPSPGVGKYVEVITSEANLIFGTIAFTNGLLEFKYSTAVSQVAQSSVNFLTSGADNFLKLSANSINNSVRSNQHLHLNANADSIVGD